MKKVQIPTRDLTDLSAYLDGQLRPRKAARLETRLVQEPDLNAALKELKVTRKLIKATPHLRSPRNFILTPEMAGLPIVRGAQFAPAYRIMSAVASLLFILVISSDLLVTQTLKYAPATELAAPSVEMVQDNGAALEKEIVEKEAMEIPAAEIIVEGEALEADAFSQAESTPVDQQKSGAAADDRALESEPPSEPPLEPPAAGEVAVEVLEAVPAEEVETQAEEKSLHMEEESPLMIDTPPTEETGLNAKEVAIEELPEVILGEESERDQVDQEPWDAKPDTPAGRTLDETTLEEPDFESEPELGTPKSSFPWVRMIETGLGLVALISGILAWVYRRQL